MTTPIIAIRDSLKTASPSGISKTLVTTLVLGLLTWPCLANEPSLEYRVKAAYLYNFTKFVSWPELNQQPLHLPLQICLFGDNPFGALIDGIQKRKARGRTITVYQVTLTAPLHQCHILYIGKSDAKHLPQLLQRVALQPVLTVSEIHQFAEKGGMIQFVTIDNRIRLNINLAIAKKSKIELSAQLLEISANIYSE